MKTCPFCETICHYSERLKAMRKYDEMKGAVDRCNLLEQENGRLQAELAKLKAGKGTKTPGS